MVEGLAPSVKLGVGVLVGLAESVQVPVLDAGAPKVAGEEGVGVGELVSECVLLVLGDAPKAS